MKRQRSTYNLSCRSVLPIVARRVCTRLAVAAAPSNRGMSMPLLTLGFLVSALSGVSRADPYWIAWEGNDFPENEGWLREGVGDRSVRSLSGGVMTMDSLANENGQDFYSIYGATDPGPGEEFVVQWCLRVNDIVWDNPNFRYDPGWAINSADGWYVSFVLGVNELHSLQEQVDVEFDPGLFHEWEFRSANMRTFTISLDRSPVWSGAFVPGLPYAKLSWGDTVWGPTSHVEWDYFHVGVVPEPSSFIASCVVFVFFRRRLS